MFLNVNEEKKIERERKKEIFLKHCRINNKKKTE
jgi:hypothetical protein